MDSKAYADKVRGIIKDNLIKFRNKNGLTQIQVAQSLGLKDFSTYRSWETGRSTPPHYRLLQLAEKYNVGIENFYDDPNEKNKKVASPSAYDKETYGDKYLSELSNEEKLLIMQIRTLNKSDREKVENFINKVVIDKL